GAAGDSRGLWCADWTHVAANADDSAGRKRALGRAMGWHIGDIGGCGYSMSEPKHVHVIGIGGSAMAPLAGMLREHGYRVTGSDSGVYPPASTLLDSLGIAFYNTFDAAHVQPAPHLV